MLPIWKCAAPLNPILTWYNSIQWFNGYVIQWYGQHTTGYDLSLKTCTGLSGFVWTKTRFMSLIPTQTKDTVSTVQVRHQFEKRRNLHWFFTKSIYNYYTTIMRVGWFLAFFFGNFAFAPHLDCLPKNGIPSPQAPDQAQTSAQSDKICNRQKWVAWNLPQFFGMTI